jgi:hypothetical protein
VRNWNGERDGKNFRAVKETESLTNKKFRFCCA